MTKQAKFAGVQIVFNFTVEDEEGDVTPVSTQAQVIPAKAWRTEWETKVSKDFKEQILVQLVTPTPIILDEQSNGKVKAKK